MARASRRYRTIVKAKAQKTIDGDVDLGRHGAQALFGRIRSWKPSAIEKDNRGDRGSV